MSEDNAVSENTTPEKYRPTSQEWQDKDVIYELYWGERIGVRAMVDRLNAPSRRAMQKVMDKHGIPTRPVGYREASTTSPFTGFYNDDEPTRDSYPSNNYDPEYSPDDERPYAWEEVAERDPIVTSVSD